ncbi:MAG: putative signal transduction protein containing sensor and EAL domain [Gammaproteobacteria bacterium]|nr:putative signal transduction protein containing sensor and EAL domain [Gammaproteobacteria bacterium]
MVQEGFFVTGLFSILDALLDHPFEEVLKQLPLSDNIVVAIVNYDGPLGAALKCSIACERCHWSDIVFADLPATDIYDSYTQSISWARQSLAGL